MTRRVVWAYSEDPGLAGEASTAARRVAEQAGADSLLVELSGSRAGTGAPGRLVISSPSLADATPETAAEAIGRAAEALAPILVLVGSTRDGREVASRLAARLGVGCVSDATSLSSDGKSLVAERSAFAGRVAARVGCGFPCVCTVKPGVQPRALDTVGPSEAFDAGDLKGRSRVVSRTTKVAGEVDLKKAKVIVSAGRGVKRREDLQMLQALATQMRGALGCSRPLSSDLGWLPEEHHIGLTGVTVRPDLYMAVGISGQLQHIAGMKDSKVVVAVNTDKDAPIFQAADYGIVGDLYQVIPAIRAALASGG